MTETPGSPPPASDVRLEVTQPGLAVLREAVVNHLRPPRPGRVSLRQDGIAGLNGAISNVPEGLASGILAGVNPVYGLYACIAGPVVGGLSSSTRLMMITTTSASSLAVGQALLNVPPEVRDNALFVLVLLVGAFQIVFGLLRLGRLTRFVSYSVMTGFIIGIAVLTILSQLPTVTGISVSGANSVDQTINLLASLGQTNLISLAVALIAMVLVIVLPRTRLGNFGRLVAIAVPSAIVVLANLEGVQVVQDVGAIPGGIPVPALPSLTVLTPDLVTGALAVAIIILVQGAGVSQSAPNRDGTHRSMSRDFFAHGVANIASSLFRGLPVGGSLGATSLNVIAGARTRWSAIFTGLWVATIVILIPGVIAHVAMPTLGALLIVASAGAIKPSDARTIWQTGRPSRLAVTTTFLATLLLPIQVAVGIGVALSAALYLAKSSTDVVVVGLLVRPDGQIEERKPPQRLPSDQVTVLDVYGHLFYAGARKLARLLPKPQGAQHPVVVLRLRGRTSIGATLIDVLAGYADQIQRAHRRLYLSGLSEEAHRDLLRTGRLDLRGPVRVYEATPIVGASTRRALGDARAWLVSRREGGQSDQAA